MNIQIKIYLFVGIALIALNSCNNYSISEDQAESFLKYFPVSIENNHGSEVIQTSNGSYIILSNFSDEGTPGNDRDIMVILCDEFGRQGANSPLLIGTTGIDQGNSLIAVNNGYIIAGSSNFSGTKVGLLLKLDADGQIRWLKNYFGEGDMEFRDVAQSQDGGFIVTGYTRSSVNYDEVLLLKVSSEGDSIWMKDDIGYNKFDDHGESLLEYNNRILILGTTSATQESSGADRLLIINTTLEGRLLSDIKIPNIPGEQDLSGTKIVKDLSSNLYVLGNEKGVLSDSRIYLARVVLTGGADEIINIESSAYLSDNGSIYGYDMKPLPNNELAICGWKSINKDNDIYFGKVNNNLQLIQSNTFGSKGYQSAMGLYYTIDEGYAITGSANLGGSITTLLLKINREGNLQ